MCAHYKTERNIDLLRDSFSVSQVRVKLEDLKDTEIYPKKYAPIIHVVDKRITLSKMFWSLLPITATDTSFASRFNTYNAVSETLEEKKNYERVWRHGNRCLIPAIGFYEWIGEAGQKKEVFIRANESPIMGIAGIWEQSLLIDNMFVSYSMLTVEPNEQIKSIHDRMPVIIPMSRWKAWLDPRTTPEQAKTLCVPWGGDLVIGPNL